MHISVEARSRGNGRSLPGGIQRQQEEPGAVSGGVSADSVQKSPLELSNSTISTEAPAQKPSIARAPLNRRNIPIEAPARSSASNTYPGGIQRLETSDVKEQEESTESLQMQPQGAIGPKISSGEPQEKEEQNQELVQTKLTVGAPGDKYEQEADSMAAKVMTMPDSAIKPPIQRQTGEETEAVQMQPLVNSITPLVQRESEEEEEVQMKSQVQRASDGSSVASGSVENRLAGSKGGGSALPDDVRSFMEPRFGADFSNIKVHTDSNAVQMNKELGAQAFAHGSDIYYGAGKSPGKNELTAHELTHTIQQGAAVRMNKEVRRKPNQQFEEKEQLQAKKLPDRTLKDSLNKELRLQPLQEQEETEPLQAKELPGHNPEVSLNKELRRQPEETPDGVIQAKTLESGFTPSPLSIQRGIGDKRKAVTGIKQKIGGIKQGVVGFLKDKGNRLKEKLGIKKPPEAGKEGAQRDPKEATNKAGNSFGGEINSDLGHGVDVPTGSRPDVDMPSAKQPEVKQPETAVKPPQTEVKTPETDVKSPETGVKPPETEVTPPETTVKPPEMEVKTPETEIKAPQTEVKAPETIAESQEKVKQTQQLEQELAQIAKITEQRATLKDPNAIAFFDQKFQAIVGEGNNPKKIVAFEGYLKGMAKKGDGDLEKGLLEDYRDANKPPEVIQPRGEMVSELPRLRQEAEKLKGEIAEWVDKNKHIIKRGEKLIETIDYDLKGVMTDMEKKGKEVTKERVQGFENNLKGVRSEFEQAKTAPPDTEIGRYVKYEGRDVEIDQIRPDGTWVNVKNYKLFGLNNPKINELIDQPEMNLRAAEANLVNGIPPTVVFDFTEGVTPEVAQRLRAINLNGRHIQVTGEEIPLPQSN